MTGPAAAWTGTPPTLSPPMSQAPPGNPHRLAAAAPPGGQSRKADRPMVTRCPLRKVTDCDLSTNGNRRSGRQSKPAEAQSMARRAG
jgi:hypothetical protein